MIVNIERQIDLISCEITPERNRTNRWDIFIFLVDFFRLVENDFEKNKLR